MTPWARKTLSSSIPNELTEGRTFNTNTKTELNIDKGKNPWITESITDNLLGALQTLTMTTPRDKNNAKTHLKKPTPFHGDGKLIRKFLQECDLYILGNAKDFPTNDSKVIFILSYIDDGEAEKWKQYFINNEVITAGSYIWPKLANFYTKVKEAFAFEDKKENSVRKLETLKQGNRNAEEMTNKFWLLVTKLTKTARCWSTLTDVLWTHSLVTRSCIPQISLPHWKTWEPALPSRKDGTPLWHNMIRFTVKLKKPWRNDNQLGAYDMLRRTPTTIGNPDTISAWKSGPVRFLPFWDIDRDWDRSTKVPIGQKTGLDCSGPVFCSLGPV